MTSFADGSLVVSYTLQNSATDWDILARTVSAAGVVGPVITLFDDTDRSDLSDLATLKNGNFVAVFESPFIGSATDLDSFFTIKTETGANVVAPTTVTGAGSTATETNPHVAALAGGGFVVTWTDSAGDESGTSQGIRATVYDASGAVVPGAGDILVNQFNQAGTQQSNDVTALPDGGFEVAWEDIAAGVDRAQRFDAAGHLIGLPVTIANLATFDVNAATLANDRPIFTFNDFSSGDNNTVSSILLNPQPDDFNVDGFSDILWQNTNGQAAIWDMNGSTVIGSGAGAAPIRGRVGKWSARATSTATAMPTSCGRTRTVRPRPWDMNGNTVIGGGAISPNPGPSWKAIGTGDFNGDGLSDILWQNANGPGRGRGNEREHRDRRRSRQPQSGAGLARDRNRRFQRRRPFGHPVAKHEQRPSLDLGNEREYVNRRRPRQSQSRAELARHRNRRLQRRRPFRHPVPKHETAKPRSGK